jgi:hypothetical protein
MDKRSLPWIGGAFIVVGLIWMSQGVGILGGSFMSDSVTWTVIGLLVAVAGLLLILGSRRR